MAHATALDVYRLTQSFPTAERYGLVSQLRRSAISIVANIAEGCGRASQRDIARFIRIALGSSNELEAQLLISRDLGYVEKATHATTAANVRRVRQMLVKFEQSILR